MVVGAVGFLASVAVTAPAMAQSEADFVKAFAGNWAVFDSGFAAGDGRCGLALSDKADNGSYALQSQNCGGELAGASRWGIADGHGDFRRQGLGAGSSRRQSAPISGTTASDKPVVIDRVDSLGAGDATHAQR